MEHSLVSGQKYEPLAHHATEPNGKGATPRKSSFEPRASPTHQISMITATSK
jgi:hypothetical protein